MRGEPEPIYLNLMTLFNATITYLYSVHKGANLPQPHDTF
jgi:hypothetical protein